MNLSTIFSWVGTGSQGSAYLPDVFQLSMQSSIFVQTDVETIYKKIFTDVIERTNGIKPENDKALWDNCLSSEAHLGLISLLAKAIAEKTDLFLVFKAGVIRKAVDAEKLQIEKDYKAGGKSSVGVYVSFKKYDVVDLIKLYSSMEYCVVGGLYKGVNVSKSLQYKINDLRQSVGLGDKAKAEAQAQSIADAFAKGHDVYMDAKDLIELAKPEMEPIQKAMQFVDNKKCFYLGLPMSYITGEQTGGLNSTGEADKAAVEKGLKVYYKSIIRPVVEALFGDKTSYKSQDYRQLLGALQAMQTFEITGEEMLSAEEKKLVIRNLLELGQADEKKA